MRPPEHVPNSRFAAPAADSTAAPTRPEERGGATDGALHRWPGELRSYLPGRGRRTLDAPAPRPVRLALAATMVFAVSVAGYFSLRYPPYRTDESSQVGYLLELRSGNLPGDETPVPTDGRSAELRAAVARPWPFGQPTIHTARNAPYPYALAILPATLTEQADVRAGPLLGFRLFSVGTMVVAVYTTYRLGRELTGDVWVGLLAGVAFGTNLTIIQMSSMAYLEAAALVATTGVAWFLARFLRTRLPVDATGLGLFGAVAACTRTMSMSYAVGAALLALGWWFVVERRDRLAMTVRLGAPAVLTVGWFYALNQVRYGDPTGASAAYAERESTRSFLDVLFSVDSLASPLDYLLVEGPGQRLPWELSASRQYLTTVGVVALVGLAMVLIARRSSPRGDTDPGRSIAADAPAPALRSWVALVALSIVPILVSTYHVAAGGASHPRYLSPLLPLIAAALALVLSRLGRVVTLVALIAAFALATVRFPAVAGVFDAVIFPDLQGPMVGRTIRGLFLALAPIAAAVILAVFAAPLVGSRRASSSTPT